MKISFLTSAHLPYDDRIFWHLGLTLSEGGHNVEIVSSKSSAVEIAQGISINSFEGDTLPKKIKIKYFAERLEGFDPDIIICSEPLPCLAGRQFKKKSLKRIRIIYDITEWYPSVENLPRMILVRRIFIILKLITANLLACAVSDAFIFGEWYKSRPYRFLYPWKPFTFIGYYPDLKYLPFNEPVSPVEILNLVYSGKICISKGFGNFINVVNALVKRYQNLRIRINIIGWFESTRDRSDCESLLGSLRENISINFMSRLNFLDFIDHIKEAHLFLDLRENNPENRYSLPIKLFYFMALGRPVIFSDLTAIRHEIRIDSFGFLVNPDHTERVAEIISNYVQNSGLYLEHCRNARKLAEEKYNWQKISNKLTGFIDLISSR